MRTPISPLLASTHPELKLNKRGKIVRGAATVILAMGDGKRSAKAIDTYLKKTAG